MSNRGLLHFGVDHLTFNMGRRYDNLSIEDSFVARLFTFVERLNLNTTNTSEAFSQEWEHWPIEFDISCEDSKHKHPMYVIKTGRHKIIRLERVNNLSQLKQIGYKYDYRITFYGSLFALDRLGQLSVKDFLSPFIEDIKNPLVTHTVSRLDICADIYGTTPMAVRRSFKSNSEKKTKKFSYLEQDPITGNYETFYYGHGSSNWKLRGYDKKLDTEKKRKEMLFPDYMKHEKVTRVEAEIKSQLLKIYQVDLNNVLDLNFLFSVYKAVLCTKYAEFKVVNFIEQQLEKQGFKPFVPERLKMNYEMLSETKYHQRFIKLAVKLHQEYNVSFISLGEEVKLLAEHNPEWLDLAYLGFGE